MFDVLSVEQGTVDIGFSTLGFVSEAKPRLSPSQTAQTTSHDAGYLELVSDGLGDGRSTGDSGSPDRSTRDETSTSHSSSRAPETKGSFHISYSLSGEVAYCIVLGLP